MLSIDKIYREFPTPNSIKGYVGRYGEKTGRNVIVYYSGWLSNSRDADFGINEVDINGFISMCEGLDFSKGLDLILHSPGGSLGAAKSLIDYLNSTFDGNIRAVIPLMVMSEATMVACSCRNIVMGIQSSLCPLDPHLDGISAKCMISEFEAMKRDVEENPSAAAVWQPIISKVSPAFLESCCSSLELADEILESSLKNNMFKDNPDDDAVHCIIEAIGSPNEAKYHNRHLSAESCRKIGLKITPMEDDEIEYDLIMSIHHSCMRLFDCSRTFKLFVNQNGKYLDLK